MPITEQTSEIRPKPLDCRFDRLRSGRLKRVVTSARQSIFQDCR